jgi:predicted transglutaminase-like cysteine proteinase
VQLTSERQALLKSVNASVNRRIRERNDGIWGPATDKWDVPTKEGDCEDFAILKKAELLKRGWPASALLLTVATYGSQGHTVLTVRTDRGDLILDNRTDAIKEWSRTPYKYFARQSQNDASSWTRIQSGG